MASSHNLTYTFDDIPYYKELKLHKLIKFEISHSTTTQLLYELQYITIHKELVRINIHEQMGQRIEESWEVGTGFLFFKEWDGNIELIPFQSPSSIDLIKVIRFEFR